MLQNTNEKIINKIVIRNLKVKKIRNVFGILAIVLLTVLIISIVTLGLSVKESTELASMKVVGGYAHGGFKGITDEQYNKLKSHKSITEQGKTICICRATNSCLQKTITEIRYSDAVNAKHSFCYPTVGTMPNNNEDIATSTYVLDLLGVKHKIGVPVVIEYKIGDTEYSKTFNLCGFWEPETRAVNEIFLSEQFINDIIGKVDKRLITSNCNYDGLIDMSIMFKNSNDINRRLKKILKDTEVSLKDEQISVNWAYFNNNVDIQTIVQYLLLIIVVVLSGYLLIYNIFYISIVGDTKFYGLIKTIGTSPKQIRKIIIKEALILSTIGIPIGIIMGYFVSSKIVPIICVNVTSKASAEVSNNPIIFIISIVLTLITVFISCREPAKIASKISPIEAVRYAGIKSIRKKVVKSRSRTKIYRLAFSNIFRNKKKTTIAILSLSLSIIIFNMVFGIVKGFDMDKYLECFIVGDYNIKPRSHYQNNVSKGLCDKINNLEGVDRIDRVYKISTRVENNEVMKKYINNEIRKTDNIDIIHDWENNLELGSRVNIYGIDEGWLNIIEGNLLEGEIDLEKYMTGEYVLVSQNFEDDYDKSKTYYKVGDEITINVDGLDKTVKIMAITNSILTINGGWFNVMGFDLFLPSNELIEISAKAKIISAQVYMKKGQTKSTEQYIKAILSDYNELEYITKDFYRKDFGEFIKTLKIIGYSLSFILAIIGILNFMNTMLTSILSRKQEFALLESVGMTNKQLRSMLIYEGLYYLLLTFVMVSTVGIAIVILSMNLVNNMIILFKYRFDYMPFLVCLLIFGFIALVVPITIHSIISKTSIIERLRMVE